MAEEWDSVEHQGKKDTRQATRIDGLGTGHVLALLVPSQRD